MRINKIICSRSLLYAKFLSYRKFMYRYFVMDRYIGFYYHWASLLY
jgi:hypothetical protein